MQFTTPDMREITISDKSEACDFIKDSCKECNRKYECTGENAAFCNHMKNILVAKYGAAEGCLKESRIRHSMGVANFLFAYAKSHDWSKEETEDLYLTGLLHDIGYIDNPKGTDHGRLGAEILKRNGLNAEICELISCHGRFIENPSRKQALLWLADLCVNRDGDYIGYQKDMRVSRKDIRMIQNVYFKFIGFWNTCKYIFRNTDKCLCLLWIPKDKLPYYV